MRSSIVHNVCGSSSLLYLESAFSVITRTQPDSKRQACGVLEVLLIPSFEPECEPKAAKKSFRVNLLQLEDRHAHEGNCTAL